VGTQQGGARTMHAINTEGKAPSNQGRGSRMRRFLVTWGPAVAYMVAVFFVSGDPEPPQPPGWAVFDKQEHMAAYFGLGLLLFWAFRGYWGFSRPLAGVLAVLAGAAYGLFDEMHQLFVPQRSSDVGDALADLVGVVAAQLAIALVVGLRASRRARRAGGPGGG